MSNSKAIIICIGDELLIGQTIDTNSAYIAKAIAEIGFDTIRKYTIGDKVAEINTALKAAIADANLVVITGGLGPTKDDITKHTLNQFFGGTLVRNETILAHVRNFFEKRNRPMLATNEAQADVPDNCTVLFNRIGTAPGMLFKKEGCTVVSLPGVPAETKVIIQEELIPRLKSENNFTQKIVHRHILTYGFGESFLAEKIKDIEDAIPSNIKLAYLPHNKLLKLRLSLLEQKSAEDIAQLDVLARLIKDRVSEYVIGEEDKSLANVVVDLLAQNRLTVATAESCTAGQIASTLADVPGASQVFLGSFVTYDNDIKHKILSVKNEDLETVGAVSAEVVIQMAQNCRMQMGTDIAVAVSGILGPSGGTPTKPVGLVYIAIDSKFGTQHFAFNYHYDRLLNKEMVVADALNLIRKEALLFS